MNFANLRQNQMKLIKYMEAKGYSRSYIQMVKSEISHILNHEQNNEWESYYDIYEGYKDKSKSHRRMIGKATVIGLIANFDLYDLYPNNQNRHRLWDRTAYGELLPEFKGLVDHYISMSNNSIVKESNIRRHISVLSNFLLFLQNIGCNRLENVTEKQVLSYFSKDGINPVKSAGTKNTLRRIFCTCSDYSATCNMLASFCPPIHNRRKNIQYITEAETELLKSKMADGILSIRDKAILCLLLYLGLRACDIASITFQTFDWKTDRLCLCQSKTEVPIELPLLPIVGNAVFDYITKDRPMSNNDHIFLGISCPHSPLTPKGISNITSAALVKSGIRLNPVDRKGTHIFRHRVATSMLMEGISQPVITKVLGHTAPDSLEPYLHADFSHLKECAISIECYPVSEEVFMI